MKSDSSFNHQAEAVGGWVVKVGRWVVELFALLAIL